MTKCIPRRRKAWVARADEGLSALRRLVRITLAVGILARASGSAGGPPQVLYVSPAGQDAWTGRLPAPNREGTDGPLASIARARDAVRRLKAEQAHQGPVTVQLRGGQYFLERPVTFGPEDCRFVNIGTYAVCLSQGRGNTVRQCDVAHAGGGGILILESRGNSVSDNHLHHLGEAYHHVGGIVIVGTGSSDNVLSHNAIHDSSRYGISLKEPGRNNLVEFNRIQNTNLETADTGGIEVTQQDRSFRSGSTIRNNLVADTIGFSSTFGVPTYMSWGIYLDSFASGYEVSGNVVCRTWNGGIMLQGGRDNRVVNNVFVDGQVSQGTFANFEKQSMGLQVLSNIFAFSAPGAVMFMTGTLGPEVIRIDRNLYFPPRGAPPVFGSGGAASFFEWRRQGWDTSSLVADPHFRQPRVDDYALLAGSPAFRLGFQAQPMDQVGPRTRRCLCQIRSAGSVFWGVQPTGPR